MIRKIINTSTDIDNVLELSDRQLKLGEEYGELCEAVLHKRGLAPHKTMKEELSGEVADVIICAIDVLCAAYPDLTTFELNQLIEKEIDRKVAKWKEVNQVRFNLKMKNLTQMSDMFYGAIGKPIC